MQSAHLLQDVVFLGHHHQFQSRPTPLDHLDDLGVRLAYDRLSVDADHLVTCHDNSKSQKHFFKNQILNFNISGTSVTFRNKMLNDDKNQGATYLLPDRLWQPDHSL